MTSIELDDRTAFEALATRHRRELQLHCYRMLGSLEESEDLVQETFLRAWRRRETFAGALDAAAWLYRIATNACLDALQRQPAQAAGGEVPWLQPYPDELLEGIAEPEAEPDAQVVAKETIELAFMVAIQHLPPKTRAVLILRDVLDWPAKDTAALLETSVAAVNSALQRARAGLKEHLPERRAEWAPGADPDRGRARAARPLRRGQRPRRRARHRRAHARGLDVVDAAGARPLARARRDRGGLGRGRHGHRGVRRASAACVTSANLQPAVACYLKRPGETEYRALALDVLRIEEGEIADITSFTYAGLPGVRPAAEALMRFERRIVSVPPGGALDYDEADWRDALVLVVRGEIELGGERFGRGSVLSLAGLPLRALHNRGRGAGRAGRRQASASSARGTSRQVIGPIASRSERPGSRSPPARLLVARRRREPEQPVPELGRAVAQRAAGLRAAQPPAGRHQRRAVPELPAPAPEGQAARRELVERVAELEAFDGGHGAIQASAASRARRAYDRAKATEGGGHAGDAQGGARGHDGRGGDAHRAGGRGRRRGRTRARRADATSTSG